MVSNSRWGTVVVGDGLLGGRDGTEMTSTQHYRRRFWSTAVLDTDREKFDRT